MTAAARGTRYLCVDLGGTRMRLALFDEHGAMTSKVAMPTDTALPESLTESMRSFIRERAAEVKLAVVGVPGPISYRDGVPLRLPNLPDWEGQVTAEKLSSELGLRALLANDADLAALGEHRFGAGRGVEDMVYVTSSTGVGAGVIIGGRLLHGVWSLAEAGHTIIDWRSGETVEDLGSGTALARLSGVRGEVLDRQIADGDELALAVFRQVATAFATGVHNLVHCFMPERVVIGGGVSRAGDFLMRPVREQLDNCDKGCPVTGDDVFVASAGDDVGLLGGFAYAIDVDSRRTAQPRRG